MFCSQCGTKNDDSAKFCSSCGSAIAGLGAATQAMQGTADNPSSDTTSNSVASPSSGSWKVGPLEIVIAVLVVVGLIYFKLNDSSKEAPPTNPSAAAPVTKPSPEELAERARRSACDWDIAKELTAFASNKGRIADALLTIGHDIAWKSGQQGFDLERSSVKIVDTGTYKFKDKALPVCVVEIALNYVNRGKGERKASCYMAGYANDREFNMYRAIFTSECDSAPKTIAKWSTENGIDGLKSETAPPTKAPAAASAEAVPVAAQIENHKKLFVARVCAKEEVTELTVQQADVSTNSSDRYAFFHISCPFEGGNAVHTEALVLIYNDKTIVRGREFLNILGGDGRYTAETGKLSYSTVFSAEGDARCCPSGVGSVVLDVPKLEMVFRRIKPQSGDERFRSRDVALR